MKIFLLGYMGSGKSYIGKRLSDKLGYDFLDMDNQIEEKEGKSISEIFDKKGEVYFRKLERRTLEELIQREEPAVISLGGGTPCYGDNMELIKNASDITSFYLKLNITNLTDRLDKEKEHRPMISHLEDREKLEEFIRKHLFERGFYYNQSNHVISCDEKSAKEIIEEISEKLG
ncbi:shikimate kinase [Christiangramia gaetbulicola]|uniref:Shikimate kinase n=1 Tax=Christiangramia gaetbulicola TaxID=703340 RepID=A0A2T6AEK3_9FLAO|nr:shikimate kinase [Christiangramia gaetbulicola]PTX42248.1 shikimate kinase [Christiangramia gaetbulicola]